MAGDIKVGDRVRVTSNYPDPEEWGRDGVLVDIDPSRFYPYIVTFETDPSEYVYTVYELEVIDND